MHMLWRTHANSSFLTKIQKCILDINNPVLSEEIMTRKKKKKSSLIEAKNETHPGMNNAQGDLRVRVGSESDIDNATWQGKRKPANMVYHKGERECVSRRLSWEYSANTH